MDYKLLSRLDETIENTLITNNDDPDSNVGALVMVLHKGEEVFFGAYGERDKEKHLPMTRDTIFRCYSMTKPITSVAVMRLVERGELSLSDTVDMYLPGFKDQKVLEGGKEVPVKRKVTIKHLLNMTAGVVYPDMSFPAGERMENLQKEFYDNLKKGIEPTTYEFANMVGQCPLEFHPGEAWRYSYCADVLGAVIEVVSGMSFGEYLRKYIFDPLQMPDTDFYVHEGSEYRLAVNYEYKPDIKSLVPCDWQHLCLSHFHLKKPRFESGGAGLVSTIDDYAHFSRMLLGRGEYGGARIIGDKTLKWMTMNHLDEKQLRTYDWDDKGGYGYGCLMRVMMEPEHHTSLGEAGEYGWDGWLGSYMLIDPKNDLGLVYVIQKCGGNGYRDIESIRNIVYSAL